MKTKTVSILYIYNFRVFSCFFVIFRYFPPFVALILPSVDGPAFIRHKSASAGQSLQISKQAQMPRIQDSLDECETLRANRHAGKLVAYLTLMLPIW